MYSTVMYIGQSKNKAYYTSNVHIFQILISNRSTLEHHFIPRLLIYLTYLDEFTPFQKEIITDM